MGKIKKLYHAYKDIKKNNPRKHAFLQLGLWILFFLCVYMAFFILPKAPVSYSSSSTKSDDFLENYQSRENFQYHMTFTYNENTQLLEGTYYEKKNYITYANKEYFVEDGISYVVDSALQTLKEERPFFIQLSIKELSPSTISLWIQNGTLEEQMKYKDGRIKTTYRYEIEAGSEILLTVLEEDYEIQEVELDLTNYLMSKNMVYSSFKVDITYSEINNLMSYSKNYDQYQKVEVEDDTVENRF